MRDVMCALLSFWALTSLANESDSAELRLKVAPLEVLRYAWTIRTSSQSEGRDMGRPFSLNAEREMGMTLVIKGLPRKSDEATPVTIRIEDVSCNEKHAVGKDSSVEVIVSKNQVKAVQDGKVVIDSHNDIGLDKVQEIQQRYKALEISEIKAVLDSAGRQKDIQGEPEMVEAIRHSTNGIFPILAAKTVKVGEFWDDEFKMDKLGDFKLAKPALVRSKMTFTKWQEKEGRKLALIEVISAWEKQDLKGENAEHLLVEITKVEGRGVGTCLFDPASGRFVEGTLEWILKYRLDGEKDGQAAGLDVSGKTSFSFGLKSPK